MMKTREEIVKIFKDKADAYPDKGTPPVVKGEKVFSMKEALKLQKELVEMSPESFVSQGFVNIEEEEDE